MLGHKSIHAEECYNGCFIGANYVIDQNLSNRLIDSPTAVKIIFVYPFVCHK